LWNDSQAWAMDVLMATGDRTRARELLESALQDFTMACDHVACLDMPEGVQAMLRCNAACSLAALGRYTEARTAFMHGHSIKLEHAFACARKGFAPEVSHEGDPRPCRVSVPGVIAHGESPAALVEMLGINFKCGHYMVGESAGAFDPDALDALDWDASHAAAAVEEICQACAEMLVAHAGALREMFLAVSGRLEGDKAHVLAAVLTQARAWYADAVIPEELRVKQTQACGACGELGARLACSRCKRVHYCHAACQKKAWKAHKLVCGS
jgi:hypothetical protein